MQKRPSEHHYSLFSEPPSVSEGTFLETECKKDITCGAVRTRTPEKSSDRRERLRESSRAVTHCQQSIKKISIGARHRTRTPEKRATAGSDYANRPVRSRTGVLGGIRTHGLSLRRRTLYPAELRRHFHFSTTIFYSLSSRLSTPAPAVRDSRCAGAPLYRNVY